MVSTAYLRVQRVFPTPRANDTKAKPDDSPWLDEHIGANSPELYVTLVYSMNIPRLPWTALRSAMSKARDLSNAGHALDRNVDKNKLLGINT